MAGSIVVGDVVTCGIVGTSGVTVGMVGADALHTSTQFLVGCFVGLSVTGWKVGCSVGLVVVNYVDLFVGLFAINLRGCWQGILWAVT